MQEKKQRRVCCILSRLRERVQDRAARRGAVIPIPSPQQIRVRWPASTQIKINVGYLSAVTEKK